MAVLDGNKCFGIKIRLNLTSISVSNALSGFDCLRFDRNKTRELCGFFLKLRKNLSEELEVIYILHTYIYIQPLFIHDILLGNKIVQ